MTEKTGHSENISVGVWAKRCYFAGRAAMEDVLRPYGLGTTQWYVLFYLTQDGPTMQRELLRKLQVERATLSAIVGTLVRKGLVEQVSDHVDHRQKRLRLTASGAKLWTELPDLELINNTAFQDMEVSDVTAAVRVLQIATERLERLSQKNTDE